MSKKNEYDMTIYVNHENYDNVISKINASFNSIKNEEKKNCIILEMVPAN